MPEIESRGIALTGIPSDPNPPQNGHLAGLDRPAPVAGLAAPPHAAVAESLFPPHLPSSVVPEGAAYPIWINDRVRAELRRLRLALGKSPHALAAPGILVKQTIVNIENGTHSPSLTSLALHCQLLGTTVEAVVIAATRRDGPPRHG